MTIITDESSIAAVHLGGQFDIPVVVAAAPIEIPPEEKPCYDLLCDQLRELLIEKGFMDEKGEFGPELHNHEPPDLDEQAISRLKNLIESNYSLVFSDRSCSIQVPLSFIPNIVNNYLNKKGGAESEFVGGIVSYILGAAYYVAALEALGVENADSYVSENTKKSISNFPPDIDVRTVSEALTSHDLYQIESKVIQYVSHAIFKRLSRETYTIVNRKAFIKKMHFIDLRNDYFIATFGDRSTYSVDNLVISKMEREQLFSRDALKIPCPLNFSVEDLNGKSCKPTSSWLRGWPAILSKLTKTISVKEPESVNHFGWPMLLSYMSRGYSCLNEDSEATLRSTFVDFLLKQSDRVSAYAGIVNKVVGDHQDNDFVSACFMHLNAGSGMGGLLTHSNWKEVIRKSKNFSSSLHFVNRLIDLFWIYHERVEKDQMKALISAELSNYKTIESSEGLIDALTDLLYLPYGESDVGQQVQERARRLQEVIQPHTKQNTPWVDALLEIMQHEEVPLEVIKAVLVVSGSQHFQRAFDSQRDSEYVLKKHCGKDYLQVRVRNLGKIQTLLLPYDHQKALTLVSDYLSAGLSDSAYDVFSKFWNLVHSGAVCGDKGSSRLHYLKKVSGELPMNFGQHPLGVAIDIQQILLQFNQTGDKVLLLQLYSLLSEFVESENDGVQKELVISQVASALHATYPKVDFSSAGELVNCKKFGQIKATWLKILIDLDDPSIAPEIFKLINKDIKVLGSCEHKTLFSHALKKEFSKDNSLMIQWVALLWDKKVYSAIDCVGFAEKMVERMGRQVNPIFLEKITRFAHRLCGCKWGKNKKRCISDHPVFDLVLSCTERLVDAKLGGKASRLLTALPNERSNGVDKSLRQVWMMVFDELISADQVDLEQAAKHWNEGVLRSVVDIRQLQEIELQQLIAFAHLLLKSENTKFQETACSLARELHNTKISPDLRGLFSLFYSDYYEYLVKGKKTQDIEATIKGLNRGKLSVESVEQIEKRQFEYLLSEKKYEKALSELTKYFSRVTPGLHRPKVDQLIAELISYDKPTKQEWGQRFSVVQALFSQKSHEFKESIRNTKHLERLIKFSEEYLKGSDELLSEQNTYFLFRVIEVLFTDNRILFPPKISNTLCTLLTDNLSSVNRYSHRMARINNNSLQCLMKTLVEDDKSHQVIKLINALNLSNLVTPDDKQFMEWVIAFIDEVLRKKTADPEIISICIQLSKSLLTNFYSSKEELSEPFSRIAMCIIEKSIHENNMGMLRKWVSTLRRLFEEHDSLEIDGFKVKLKTWIDALREGGRLDDATNLMEAFEGDDLSDNLATTLSLIKARVVEKQYAKALELLGPYKRKDLEECDELKECVVDILSELMQQDFSKNTFTLIHQALMKTANRELGVWEKYLDRCLQSKSADIMERGRNGFMAIFNNRPEVKKSIEYKLCYAKMIELVCQSQPEKSIDLITKLPGLWKILKGKDALELRRGVTKTVILTMKKEVITKASISAHLLDQLIKLFQREDYEALFKDDLETKSLLELSAISVFFRVNDGAMFFAVVNWYMGYPMEYRGVKFIDEHYDVFNEIIDAIVQSECREITAYLNLYSSIFSLIRNSKNKRLHTLKFFVHCLSHSNPILANFAAFEAMKVFPFLTELMKEYSHDVALKNLASSSKKKGRAQASKEANRYCTVFTTLCWLLKDRGAFHILAEFIEDPDLTLVVPSAMITEIKQKNIDGVLEQAVALGDRPSIDRAISFYICHREDISHDREFHLACLGKVFDLTILQLTKYKDYSAFINSIQKILAALYKEDGFLQLPFYSLMKAAFGPKIETAEGVSFIPQSRSVVGNVLILHENQMFYKLAIMMVKKLLRAKSDDSHAHYLLMTVSYMVLSQLIINKKKAESNLLECIRDFFLSEIPLNDLSLYSNHMNRCLRLLGMVQQTGMLYSDPDLYGRLCMNLASPIELSKMLRKENIKFYRDAMISRIKTHASQNTFSSLNTMFSLFYRSFPSLFKGSVEYQRKAFHHIFEAIKVNPLEEFPKNQAFEIIYEKLSGEQSQEVKQFLMQDISGEFGVYQDVLSTPSERRFVTPGCCKMDYILQKLFIDKYRFSKEHEPVDIKLDPSIMLMAGSTVGEVIVADANEENYDKYTEFFEVVGGSIQELLVNKKIKNEGFGLCLGAITKLSSASIKLYTLNSSSTAIKRVSELIKEYSLSSSTLLGASVLRKWIEDFVETGDDELIAVGQLVLEESIVDLKLDEVAPGVVTKMKQLLKVGE